MNLSTEVRIPERIPPGPVESTTRAVPGELIDVNHSQRVAVEAFIANRFLEIHGARISVFMPELLVHFDQHGRISAAIGIRRATDQPLFLEYYLDLPVEQVLSGHVASSGTIPQREQIVEIGNLASIDRLASRWLFRLLVRQLTDWRYEWAVFTGCTALNRMFAGLGIETLCLARALQSRLPVEQQTWGDYYEDSPKVLAGRVSLGSSLFSKSGSGR